MNAETIPTVQIALPGISDASLAQLIEVLQREGAAVARFPFAQMDELARHYDTQIHVALLERYSRHLANDRIRNADAKLPLLGASVRHSNPEQIPA